jgi:ribonuclease VapC
MCPTRSRNSPLTGEIVPFGPAHARSAALAWRRFGEGRHPAALNFGDYPAYAVADVADAPLLYKGDDFSLTDVRAALV